MLDKVPSGFNFATFICRGWGGVDVLWYLDVCWTHPQLKVTKSLCADIWTQQHTYYSKTKFPICIDISTSPPFSHRLFKNIFFSFLLLMSRRACKSLDRSRRHWGKKAPFSQQDCPFRKVAVPLDPQRWRRRAQSVSGKLNWQEIHPLMKRTKELITLI